MDILTTIAERKIREAMARGELDNLAGAGQLLTMDEDPSVVPAELRKEIVSLREMLGTLEDDAERRTVKRQLDFKLLKLNMLRRRPLDLDDFPVYRDKVIDRLGG